MNPLLNGNGEIELLVDDSRHNAIDGLEPWQVDALLVPSDDSSSSASSNCLMNIDKIATKWMKSLTPEQWSKIKRQQSLFGVPLPEDWIKVWRFILKEPSLRDAERATRGGKSIGSYPHLWNIWSEECIEKYTDDLDKELIQMVDNGFLYDEIGNILLGRYGEEFWKPRKEVTKTTPSQVVNNYLYWKIPNKIARAELLDMCLKRIADIKKMKKNKKAPNQTWTY